MAELKRNFSGADGAKMNKDLDERIMPPGQYRDALNIEISTSEGSDAGTAQNIKGNTKRSAMVSGIDSYAIPDTSTCVGSVASLNTDKVYYFVAAGDSNSAAAAPAIKKDYVMEYDPVLEKHKYVFVDIYQVDTACELTTAVGNDFLYIPVESAHFISSQHYQLTGVRPGMELVVEDSYTHTHNVIVTDVGLVTLNLGLPLGSGFFWKVFFNKKLSDFVITAGDSISFVSPERVLNFDKNNIITGINILDDFIFWTDNETEPKKINIKRSIAGTGGLAHLTGASNTGMHAAGSQSSEIFVGDRDYFHTRLVKGSGINLSVAYKHGAPGIEAVWVEEKHATVIKKAPTQPLELGMSRNKTPRYDSGSSVINPTWGYVPYLNLFPDSVGALVGYGDILEDVTFSESKDFWVGDVLLLSVDDGAGLFNYPGEDYDIRVEVLANNTGVGPSENTEQQLSFRVKVLSIRGNLAYSDVSFKAIMEESDRLFEFKFPRFSYRYKYQDGEYSTFAPWSVVAFLPGVYGFVGSEGYNLGMANQLRSLSIAGYYAGEKRFAEDVVEIDILYKETNNPTVYTLKTITPKDTNEWPLVTSMDGVHASRGKMSVTTDLIHEVVPANQLLRPWDNVPRKALAQDISANRLVYGNYLQSYDVESTPKVMASYESTSLQTSADSGATTSVKSIRDYKLGVVFSDRYGRETPVLTSASAGIKMPKKVSDLKNRIQVNLSTDVTMPSWAEYYSYYIKESTVEYYNVIADRWYSDPGGDTWVSVPSSDRNKVDETSILVLKKKHGAEVASKGESKYKVTAIENSAPESIKGVMKPIAVIFNDDDYVGNSEVGFPFKDTTWFSIANSPVHEVLGSGFGGGTFKKLAIRFSGNGKRSKYYDIESVTSPPNETSGGASVKYVFRIKGKFGSDVLFATDYLDTWAGRIDNLSIEFLSVDTEHKPEFDGRFFVKIQKDPELERDLMDVSTIEDYIVVDQAGVRYLHNNGYSNQVLGAAAPDAPLYHEYSNTGGYTGGGEHDLHPTEYAHIYDDAIENQTPYYWGGSATTDGTSTSYGLAANDFNVDSIALLNNDNWTHSGGAGDASDFWYDLQSEGDFFIDSCTAYTWTAEVKAPEEGSGNFFSDLANTSASYSGQQPYYWSGIDSTMIYNQSPGGVDWTLGPWTFDWQGEVQWDQTWANPEYYMFGINFAGGNVGANMKPYKGLPSRGIRDGGVGQSYMDISWIGGGYDYMPGFGPTFTGDEAQYGPLQLKNSTEELHQQRWKFMERLVTPGTRFRFRKDPDETLYTVKDYKNTEEGWGTFSSQGVDDGNEWWLPGTDRETGAFGIRNYLATANENQSYHWFRYANFRQRWSIVVEPRIGSGINGYNPIHGTKAATQGGPVASDPAFTRALHHDASDSDTIEIIEVFRGMSGNFTPSPAIFETQPKESADIDIYYQTGGLIPLQLNDKTNEEYLPLGTTFKVAYRLALTSSIVLHSTHTITEWTDAETIRFTPALPNNIVSSDGSIAYAVDGGQLDADIWGSGDEIVFTKRGNYSLTARMRDAISTVSTYGSVSTDGGDTWTPQTEPIDTIRLHGAQQANDVTVPDIYKLYSQTHYLDWNNCWAFGNGVESDRIRDDYNASQMDNGVKASSTIETQIKEERRKHGIIHSGIYNSTAGINNTNQFIAAESITKDINPVYGSIQKLYNRDTRLIIFCEDKILNAVTNKDALYNADGNPQLISSNVTIGNVTPYQGDFGISKNPESFVATPYQMYFTDVARGQVLRLTTEGIVSISDKGMKDYFADICSSNIWKMIGTGDERRKEYNLSILKKHEATDTGYLTDSTTISYNEYSKGWVSFKSFIPQHGLSINNKYLTFYNGHIWEHYTNDLHNDFYGTPYQSSITAVFNDQPGSIKSFGAVNYEGSQAKVTSFIDSDGVSMLNGVWTDDGEGITLTDGVTDKEYFNLVASGGWYVDNITTDQQKSGNIEFKNKEGKWFGYPSGETTTLANLDEREFTVQGLGTATVVHSNSESGDQVIITIDE